MVAVALLALPPPAVAAILVWGFLNESLTAYQGVGFVLALTAIAAAFSPANGD